GEMVERALDAALSIQAIGTSACPSGYGPPFIAPWYIVDTSTADYEVNYPGDLIEQVDAVGDVGKRLKVARVAALTAALAVQPGSGVPEGWKLVPVEPTPQMRQAFHAAHEEYE